MGKKSKRVRSGGDRPAQARRSVDGGGPTEAEEETAANLRFEDPFADEFEGEVVADLDGGEEEEDAEKHLAVDGGEGAGKGGEGGGGVRAWNPLSSDPLPPGEELEVDESAYKMRHALRPEWPALSFDFLGDDLGSNRTRFPHTALVAVGSQADRPERNSLTVMRLSDLGRTGYVRTREQEDDEYLGEEYDRDDDEDDEDDDDVFDLDPVVEPYSLPHPSGGINRVRSMPQHPEVVATWSEAGSVSLYDVGGVLDAFGRSSGGGGGGEGRKIRRDPFLVYSGHETEGYAMDWSPVKAGRMATGDCAGGIHIWEPAEGMDGGGGGRGGRPTQWSSVSFTVTSTYAATGGSNLDNPSVEDVQWSPTEATVFATAECGGYVRVYDVRCRDRPMITSRIHPTGADVNVLAWNGHVSNLLATGGDDGMLSVWDLRNFRPGGAGGGGDGDGDAPAPLARFTAHRNPITGLEWHPTDESMLAVSDEAGAYIYDLSIEEDEPQDGGAGEGAGGGDGELPPQLLFVHCGSESVKEVHWHPQVASMVMTTALSGFSLFIPSNL